MPVYVYEKSDTQANGTTIRHRAKSSPNRFYFDNKNSVLLIVRLVPAKAAQRTFRFYAIKSMFGNKYQVFI